MISAHLRADPRVFYSQAGHSIPEIRSSHAPRSCHICRKLPVCDVLRKARARVQGWPWSRGCGRCGRCASARSAAPHPSACGLLSSPRSLASITHAPTSAFPSDGARPDQHYTPLSPRGKLRSERWRSLPTTALPSWVGGGALRVLLTTWAGLLIASKQWCCLLFVAFSDPTSRLR